MAGRRKLFTATGPIKLLFTITNPDYREENLLTDYRSGVLRMDPEVGAENAYLYSLFLDDAEHDLVHIGYVDVEAVPGDLDEVKNMEPDETLNERQ